MPFYRYQAFDAAGKSLEGTLQANSEVEAAQALSRQGMRVTHVTDVRQQARATTPAAPPMTAAPRVPERAAPLPGVRMNTIRSNDLGPPRKTRRGSEKKLMLIFAQLQSYFKAGLNPQRAFLDLSQRSSSGEYAESLKLISDRTTEGGRMSDVMELFPYLYPPHVVGIVRAGETGGFLPEAMGSVSGQIEASYKMKRWIVILGLIGVLTAFIVIVLQLMLRSAIGSWNAQDAAGGTLPGGATLAQQMGKELLWPVGPITLITIAVVGVGMWLWTSMPLRDLRHRMVLFTPTIGKRAKKESLGLFSWVLSMMTKGGASPSEAWNHAVGAMPNLAMRKKMEAAKVVPGDTRKLSTLLESTKTLPVEFGHIVQTGEITGDVPGALMHVSETTQNEFTIQDKASKLRIGCWIFLLMGVGVGIGIMMYAGYMSKLIQTVTE